MFSFASLPRTMALAISTTLAIATVSFSAPRITSAADPTTAGLAGYADYQTLQQRVKKLDEHPRIEVRSIGKSLEGRDLLMLVFSGKDDKIKADAKPALAIVGNIEAAHLLGGDLVLALCDDLVARVDSDEKLAALLDHYTLYVIPRPDPDGSEKCFAEPRTKVEGNARKTDDDRDFEVGEDPADDLNGDGIVGWMRVEDPTGKWMPHPNDPHLMVEADRSKGEVGRYHVYPEGRDDDNDGELNEDASLGVSLDRNFPHRYEAFEKLTGEHAASEPETKAIIDFLFDHRNVIGVFALGTDDNLFHPWKPNQQAESQRIAQHIHSADAPLQDFLAAEFKKIHGGNDCPAREPHAGSFSQWAYFHYGRWSLVSRGWWVPPMPLKPVDAKTAEKKSEGDAEKTVDENAEPKPAASEPAAATVASAGTDVKPTDPSKPGDEKTAQEAGAKPVAEDKRLESERNAMRYLASRGIATSTDWASVDHPDFPGKKVEVGGPIPMATIVPPIEELAPIAQKHLNFIATIPEVLPSLKLVDTKVENLGGGLVRVSTKLLNSGRFPTMSRMGEITRAHQKLEIEIVSPLDAKFVIGSKRKLLDRIEGGSSREVQWLLRYEKEVPPVLQLKFHSATIPPQSIEISIPAVATKEAKEETP